MQINYIIVNGIILIFDYLNLKKNKSIILLIITGPYRSDLIYIFNAIY